METTASVPGSTPAPALYRDLPKPTLFQAFKSRYGVTVITTLNLLLFFWIWQIVQGGDDPLIATRIIPAPVTVVDKFIKAILNGRMWYNGSFSMLTYFAGMSITIFIFIPIGIFLGINPVVRGVSEGYVWILYTMPTIALLPVMTVMFGFGLQSKVFLVSLQTIPPVLINVLRGVGTVDPSMMKAGRLFGANQWQLFRKITLPFILPWVMTGIRIASRRGLMAVIIAEMFGSLRGLSYMVSLGMDMFDTGTAYSAIAALMIIAIIFVNGIEWVEKKATPWKQVLKI